MLAEAQVQTSNLEMSPSETDVQIQTSFSDYISEKEETSSIEAEQRSNKSPSQYSEMDYNTSYPVYISAEAQTLPVEIPPGNDWRSARLKAAAQVQTSNILLENPASLTEGEMRVQLSKVKLEKSEMLVEELGAPLATTEKFYPSQLTEIGKQMSGAEILEEEKRSLSQHSNVQVQPITLELLKKLSLLSQIEMLESTSRTELLKKVSSLSVTEPHVQTPSYELQRKPSCLSDSATQGQVLSVELLKQRLSSAPVVASSDHEPAGKLQLLFPAEDVQAPASDLELTKKLHPSSSSHMESQGRASDADLRKYSSLSLIEAMDGNQEEITEGREYLITPQLLEAQIRKWYHEFPEMQTASQAPVQREPLLSPTVDSEVQTSSIETPEGNRWRASRLQADAGMQTSGFESSVEEVKSGHQLLNKMQSQTSLLEIWQARDLTDAQVETSGLGLTRTKVESPPPLVIDSHVQTSLFNIWKANTKADAQTQTSVTELPKQALESPPTQHIDRPAQTSFLEISEAKKADGVQQTACAFPEPKEGDSPLQTDREVQMSCPDVRKGKEKTDVLVQTSLLGIPNAQEEPLWSLQTDAVVQTSDVEIPVGSKWRASRLHADAQLQTSMLDMKKAELEPPPLSQMDTQVQTSLLEVCETKDPRNGWAQTSRMDMPKSLEEPCPTGQPENVVQSSTAETAEPSPPSQTNTEVQTSLLDLWKTKDPRDAWAQTSRMEMSKSLEEPRPTGQPENVVQSFTAETAEPSPPYQTNTEVQTSLLDLWKTKDPRDAWAQTSRMEMSKSLEEPRPTGQPENVVQSSTAETAEPSPPSQTNTEVQTSLLDLWKTKDPRDAWAQTSRMDMPKSLEEPRPTGQPENVVQSSTSETAEPSPPSQINTEVQTSLLDLWKTKDPRDVWAQTSRMDMPKSLEEPCPPAQPENVVQSSTSESSPPSQINTKVQTSLLDMWKMKDLRDGWAQTSRMDMPKSLEEPRPTAQPENVVQSSTAETAEPSPPSQINTEVQTSLLDLWKMKEVNSSLVQTSRMDMPKSLEEPRPTAQPENIVQSSASETAESSPPSQINTEVQTSLLDIWKTKEVSSSLAQTSQMDALTSVEESSLPLEPENVVQSPTFEIVESSPPSQIDTEVQTSFLDIWKTKSLSNFLAQTSQTDLSTSVEESPFSSQPENVAQSPTVETVKSPLPFQADTEAQTSFFDIWKAKELTILESQEKIEQICQVEGMSEPPIFTEAQVQTSFVEIPRGKKWRSSRLCAEAQVQTSFPDLRSKDRVPALQKMVSDHVSAKRVPKGPKRATPVSVHLHVKGISQEASLLAAESGH
uniref:Uncharacterized protein n=1 Tax=Sphaerodactylus townsendi TaxID=933632 RepID=A0ACB8FT17_9SAUR